MSTEKTCRVCGETKEQGEFYPNSGLTCKVCVRAKVAQNYRDKREQYAAYERERFQRPERKAKALEYQRNRRRNHTDRSAARNTVSNALRDGKLVRGVCVVCGSSHTEAHHPDYSKPLEIVWLCRKHHLEVHGKKVYEFGSRHDAQEAARKTVKEAL